MHTHLCIYDMIVLQILMTYNLLLSGHAWDRILKLNAIISCLQKKLNALLAGFIVHPSQITWVRHLLR